MKKIIAFVLMLLLLVPVLWALSIDAKDIIENVRDRYDDIDDAVITFSRMTSFKVSKTEQSVRGKLYFKKKNKYRIETDDRIIVTDGVTSWSYDPVNRQVMIDKYKEEAHSLSPEKLLFNYPDDFYSTLVGEQKYDGMDTYVLKLTPKEDNSFAASLKIWIDTDWLIRKVRLTDINGTVTEYAIHNVVINKGIPDSRFRFRAPEGSEEIDLR